MFAEELLRPTVCSISNSCTAYEDIRNKIQNKFPTETVEYRALIFALSYARYSQYKKIFLHDKKLLPTLNAQAPLQYDEWIDHAVATYKFIQTQAVEEMLSKVEDRIYNKIILSNKFSALEEKIEKIRNKVAPDVSWQHWLGERVVDILFFPFKDGFKHAAATLFAILWLAGIVLLLQSYGGSAYTHLVSSLRDMVKELSP